MSTTLPVTSKGVQGATLVYVSQLGSLPQSALLWQAEDPPKLAKLHRSIFTLRLTLEPPAASLGELQKRLAALYTKHYMRHDKRLDNEEHVRDARWSLTQGELAWPWPDDRWLEVSEAPVVPEEKTCTYHVQCVHHGVYMGLLHFFLLKQVDSKDKCMPLWMDDVQHRARFVGAMCTRKDMVPRTVMETVMALFGQQASIDNKSIALPAYPPRQNPGLAWTILDDYLVIPHPAQRKVKPHSEAQEQRDVEQILAATYLVRVPMNDASMERAPIQSRNDVYVLGLQCPLVRALSQVRVPPPPAAASTTPTMPIPQAKPASKAKSKSKKRARDDDDKPLSESAYSAGQLRPKRLKSMASQIPYQLFLKHWCKAEAHVDAALPVVDPECIEAWCLLGQPRRQDMGEARVWLLALRAAASNGGSLPLWFTPRPMDQ